MLLLLAESPEKVGTSVEMGSCKKLQCTFVVVDLRISSYREVQGLECRKDIKVGGFRIVGL